MTVKPYCSKCLDRGDILHAEDCPLRPHVEIVDRPVREDYDEIARTVRVMLDSWDPWSKKRPAWSTTGPT